MPKTRVFVIGLDGGSWNIIKPLIAQGHLPNMAGLMEGGAWGVLKSTFPASTCPAWFTFSTGMKPSRLGIYHFQGMPPLENRVQYHKYGDLSDIEFWDVLTQEGISSGIINNPLLYQRKPHLGFIVPGSVIPESQYLSYPEGLLDELHEVTGEYEFDQQGVYVIDDATLLSGCLRVAEKRTEAMAYLLEKHPTDFFLGVYTITDRVSHRFLTRAELGDGQRREQGWRALEETYAAVDRGIGRLVSLMGDDDCLILMSDHGFAARPWSIHLNQWLIEEGLLRIDVRGALDKLGLTQRNLGKLMNKAGVDLKRLTRLYRLAPGFLKNALPTGESIFQEYFLTELIDRGRLEWSKTQAVYIGAGIYLNTTDRSRGILPPGEAARVKEHIREGLGRLRGPNGEPGALRAVEPEEIYGEGMMVNPPDLLIIGDNAWEVENTLSRSGEVFTPNERAGHSREGIFILRHPDVKSGELNRPLEMEDMAPLMLHLFGLPALEEMDGEVRLDSFDHDAAVASRIPRVSGSAYNTRREMLRIKNRVARLREAGSI
jgi:predicted AlkP superfamily phosphohydrolase/phosphomutase